MYLGGKMKKRNKESITLKVWIVEGFETDDGRGQGLGVGKEGFWEAGNVLLFSLGGNLKGIHSVILDSYLSIYILISQISTILYIFYTLNIYILYIFIWVLGICMYMYVYSCVVIENFTKRAHTQKEPRAHFITFG